MTAQLVCNDIELGIRCSLQGELDLASERKIVKELLSVLDRKPSLLVLDLSEVQFIDSTGLRTLITCQRRAESQRTRILLASPSRAVRRLFEVTKLTDRFEYDEDGYGSG